MRSFAKRPIASLRRSDLAAAKIIIRVSFRAASNSASIARALINDPEVLLADEPTGNLDSRTSVEIMAIFQQLNERGITIIMVTHEQDIAAYAQRNVMMRDGILLSDKVVTQRALAEAVLDKAKTSKNNPEEQASNDSI